ncbi:MAG TPA: trypsin-like peptidase domain-containing protein [Pseudonocardiaceae bacterium]|jgi:putative serine protease PepD|nr:trypsin-like peptidase domain-containing protein [Pseudonocardiaceae bacterium]
MTENLPAAGDGPAEAPRHSDAGERTETGQGQPTVEPSGDNWYRSPNPQAPDPTYAPVHGPAPTSAYPPAAGPTPAASAYPPASSGPGPSAPSSSSSDYPDESPNPWSAAGFPYYGSPPSTPPGGYGPPPTGPIPGPQTGPLTAGYTIMGTQVEPRRRKGSGGLIAGIAVLALVIGGLAGALGGYLVGGRTDGPVVSSLATPPPANQASNAPAGSAQSVAGKVLPVVVTIAAEFQDQNGANGDTGSGIVISSDGNILTNNHVIASAVSGGKIQAIFADGRTVDATVVGRDPTTDIAVIKAKGVTGLPVAALGSSGSLAVGQQVVAIGAPFDLTGTVTTGIVSSLHRPTAAGDGNDQGTVLDAIQTDAAINPGNSGGPLVNMQGQIVGINSAIYSPSSGDPQAGAQGGNVGIGFAIPIDQARRTANEIVQSGHATQTVLGVQVADNVPSQDAILPNGALIKTVTSGGPADKAGLKVGAVVVKADGRLVTSSDGLVAAVHAAAPGDQMKLTLSDGSVITVTLGGQPVSTN